jgi:hypothetical protein
MGPCNLAPIEILVPEKENGPTVLWLSYIGTGATLLFWLIWLWIRKLEVPVPKVANAMVGFSAGVCVGAEARLARAPERDGL